jgi:hypothetical protein
MQAWIVERINAGDTLTDAERTFRNAIPGKVVKIDREQLREMWRVEYEAAKGEMVRPGKRVKS